MMQRKEQILLVEDDDDLRDATADALGAEGFEVSAARDGAEALTLLRGAPSKPALILLDLMMPTMNGFEFREQPRSFGSQSRSRPSSRCSIARCPHPARADDAAGGGAAPAPRSRTTTDVGVERASPAAARGVAGTQVKPPLTRRYSKLAASDTMRRASRSGEGGCSFVSG